MPFEENTSTFQLEPSNIRVWTSRQIANTFLTNFVKSETPSAPKRFLQAKASSQSIFLCNMIPRNI